MSTKDIAVTIRNLILQEDRGALTAWGATDFQEMPQITRHTGRVQRGGLSMQVDTPTFRGLLRICLMGDDCYLIETFKLVITVQEEYPVSVWEEVESLDNVDCNYLASTIYEMIGGTT